MEEVGTKMTWRKNRYFKFYPHFLLQDDVRIFCLVKTDLVQAIY